MEQPLRYSTPEVPHGTGEIREGYDAGGATNKKNRLI